MEVVCFAIHLDELGLEVGANLREDDLRTIGRVLLKYLFTKTKVDVKFENTVPAVSNMAGKGHRPSA